MISKDIINYLRDKLNTVHIMKSMRQSPMARQSINKLLRKTILNKRYLKIIKRRFYNYTKTIVGKILLFYLVWTVMVYLMAVGALWWTATSLMHDNLRSQGVEWIEKLHELGTPLYVTHDLKQFNSIREKISDFQEIGYVRYYLEDGAEVLAEYKAPILKDISLPKLSLQQISELKQNQNLEKSYLYEDDSQNSLVRVSAPVWVESISSDGMLNFDLDSQADKATNIIGYIDLGLNYRASQLRLADSIKMGSIFIAILLVLVMMLGRHIIKDALAPLTRLQKPLLRLARGEADVHVEVEGDKEIKTICNALNATIAAIRERDDKLNSLANNDALTGLANRYSFTQALEDEITTNATSSGSSAVLFIDLDKFKDINDILGHAAGDRLLKAIARLLREHTRDQDFVARYGGDEFAIIAKNTSSDAAASIAKTLINNIKELRFVEDGKSFDISFSIGISMIEANMLSPDDIMAQADSACFLAKKEGRNTYRISDATDAVQQQNAIDFSWSHKLKNALSNNNFLLYYQPIINLSTGNPDFYEVLLRLPDEDDKMISPDAFLPTAGRIGLSVEIDHWVIRNALANIAELRDSNNDITVTINLSAHTLEDARIVNFIKKQFAKYKLPSASVIFEIREQTAIRNIDKVGKCILSLNDLGCRIALDCFGSGFDTFHYIKDWPVDFLKVDGNFIEKISSSQLDNVIVEFMVRIAKALGKKTVATHVHDEAILQHLVYMGIDFAQGYYTGKPARLLTDKKIKIPKTKTRSRIRSVKS